MTLSSQSRGTHLVIVPSYNSGPRLLSTIREALSFWDPVWVVIDGSTDESSREIGQLESSQHGLKVLRSPKNQGKGAAVLEGFRAALAQGFTSALVMDSDGQHPADQIPNFMRLSRENPGAIILGQPQFGRDAPRARVAGHFLANFWSNFETLWGGIGDSLFGFRVYPIRESVELLDSIGTGRGYDFDTQLAVRLFWRGFQPINVPVPVRYFGSAAQGVSHFKYVRDNLLLIRIHAMLMAQMPWRMLRRTNSRSALAPARA
jgi:glycosyltransferase involved in cell wall biosynthesis